MNTWRNVSIVLAVLCGFLWWRGRRPAPSPAPVPAAAAPVSGTPTTSSGWTAAPSGAPDMSEEPDMVDEVDDGQPGGWSAMIPGWARWLLPQPGEDLLAYRDRLLPLAQMAVAPHRARVQRGRDDFAQVAGLDAGQLAELDAAVDEAGAYIQERVVQGLLSGELMPGQLKPSSGVAFARDVLGAVDGASQRFDGVLREDQRIALADHPFDVADYLVFAVRWEDMLGVVDEGS